MKIKFYTNNLKIILTLNVPIITIKCYDIKNNVYLKEIHMPFNCQTRTFINNLITLMNESHEIIRNNNVKRYNFIYNRFIKIE